MEITNRNLWMLYITRPSFIEGVDVGIKTMFITSSLDYHVDVGYKPRLYVK